MSGTGCRPRRAAILAFSLVCFGWPAGAVAAPVEHPHFPRPALIQPNVEFWKQVYTEHGVGDFVLHDRVRLGVVYEVVRVKESTNQVRAEYLARPEVQRARAKYERILSDLALGTPPEQLGADAVRVAQLWGCPCGPETLLQAAGNIRVQQGLREKVDEGLQRARPLMPKMMSILKRHDVPLELAALPLVESTFNPKARSKAGAVGLWQFMHSTGKRYLKITRKRDDRRDPLLATQAAARLLRHNYEALGSWPLAIVAYNHGAAGMMAATATVGSTAIEDIVARYSGPRFGFASRNFYAEFLAALDVMHPLLNGRSKTVVAKGRRPAAKATPAAPLPVAPAPPPAPPAPPVVEASLPAVQPPQANESLLLVPGGAGAAAVPAPVESALVPEPPVEAAVPSVPPTPIDASALVEPLPGCEVAPPVTGIEPPLVATPPADVRHTPAAPPIAECPIPAPIVPALTPLDAPEAGPEAAARTDLEPAAPTTDPSL
jgi:hypothetical protein